MENFYKNILILFLTMLWIVTIIAIWSGDIKIIKEIKCEPLNQFIK